MTAAAAVLPVQLEVTGLDSKAVKSNYAAFHTFRNGRTTLSCSGLLLLPPPGQQQQQVYHVLAPVTSLYPFLQQSQRSNLSQATAASLLAGVELSVLFQPLESRQQQHQQVCSNAAEPLDQQQQQLVRLPAKLLQVLPLPRVLAAADELLTSANSSGVGSWKLGWLLAGNQPHESATPSMLGHLALLQVTLPPHQQQQPRQQQKQEQCVLASSTVPPRQQQQDTACGCNKGSQPGLPVCSTCLQQQQQQLATAACACCNGPQPGLPIYLSGSPFGCLAAHQFHGALLTGIVCNVLQQPAAVALTANAERYSQHASTAAPAAAAAASGLSVGAARDQAAAAAAAGSPALFIVDAHVMPGMEGGAISCRSCHRLLGMITLPLSNSSSQVELHLGIAAPHLAAAAAVRSGVTGGVVVDQPLQQRVVFLHGLQQQLLPHGCAATADMRSQQQSVVCCSNTSAMQPMAAHNTTAGDQSAGVQLSKAAAPAAVLQPHCPHSCSGGSSSSSSCANALQAAQRGVVMVRVGRSWGSGVLMTHSGLVLTNAHLFKDSSSSSSKVRQPRNEPQLHQRGNAGAGKSSDAAHSTEASTQGCSEQAEQQQQQQQQQQLWREEAVNVRLAPDSSSSSSWMPARLLYRFQGYLDIAVLQLQLSARQSSNSSSSSSAFSQLQRHQQHMLHPLQLCGPAEDAAPGSNVFVIGHGLFGPGIPWPPAVTSGCAARVVQLANNGSSFDASRSGDSSSSSSELSLQPAAAAAAARLAHPRSSKPSMLITTAAVHGGASGGALVNAQGQLVGLVTSNARHARGATLPHCNFCIAAAELRPLWNWAQRVQQQQQQNQLGSNLSVRAVAYGASATTGTSGSSSSTPVGLAAAADAAASAAAMLRELQVLDLRDEAGSRLWALQQPLPTQRFSSNSSSGGAAAAAAVERIGRKLQAKSSKDAELHSKL